MAEQIKCPICGEMNSSELELCTNCRSPLQPKSNIPSGQNPTKKHTAELEPILPQWLREARDAARNTEPQDSPDYLQTTENKPKPAASQPDLLAGLQSQTSDDEDEEVPDWLASITGASPKSRPAKDEPATDVRWVEMGGKDDFAQSENILAQPPSRGGQEDEVPAWLAGLQNESAPEKDELTDWLRDSNETPAAEETSAFESSSFPPIQDETPDWLKQMSADAESKSQQVSSQPTSDSNFDVDTPDWLKQMSVNAEPVEAKTPQDAPELNIDTPDWLSSLGGASENALDGESAAFTEADVPEKEAESLPPMDMPDWLKSSSEVQDEKPSQDTTTPLWLKPKVQSQEPEMPAWLSSSEETVYLDQQKEEPPAQDDVLGDVPDWLKAAAPEKTIFDSQDELKSEVDSAETPDWFSNIQPSGETEIEEKAEPEKVDPFASMPAFTLDSQSEENLDGLFTEMPDWLSGATDQPVTSQPIPITNEDVLPSSDLPSWVEAMRPSDSGLSQLTSSASDQTLESRGALAGLQGVLPAVPGFTPTSKPKAYSLKLNANDEQLRHAGILEDILAAETSPVPIESFSTLMPSHALRWTLAFLMLAVIFSTTFLRTQIFSLPLLPPSEISSARQIVQSIPENAAVLVAFDYEPSRAGEMEVAAAPLFDNLLLLKHPRLTFIATNETGSVLAERFISGPLAMHNYQSGVTYSNLGYLPGGQLGIRAFAQNPSVTSPFDIFGQPAWASPTLQGVTALNQFTAMILITDNADAARVWVEQTQGLRGTIPFIVISSSQATPMIQPYYDSAQVTGIVSGLYGGAFFEQYNAGRPGTARIYWDAYSIGMLIAMALVLGGGLWNLGVGLRERREDK